MKNNKKSSPTKEPETEDHPLEKGSFPKRPEAFPIKRLQINRPRIRRPQHYG